MAIENDSSPPPESVQLSESPDIDDPVDWFLGLDGALARNIPHYEDRPEQRRMASAVFRSLLSDDVLLAEAGTGTGKTLAYLVPALLSGKRVVVSTGTRTLQDQITRHDIPLLRELMPTAFVAVTLKGVSNYLCLRKLYDTMAHGGLPPGAQADELSRIAAWSEYTETGDRVEVASLGETAPIWTALTQTPETRLGPKCPYFERCFVTQARRRAEKADLILVNHHLFFADLALRAAHPGARVLPEYEAVVFDEAHQLEDVITDHFGVRVSTLGTSYLCKDARHALIGARGLFHEPRTSAHDTTERTIGHVERTAAVFFALVRQYLARLGTVDQDRIELEISLFRDEAREEAWFNLDNALDELACHADSEARALDESTDEERIRAVFSVGRRAALMRDDLAALAEQSRDMFVYWGEARAGGVLLCGAPIDVAPYVREHVLERVPALVLTSATLTTGNTFEYLRERLGLDDDMATELLVESPFDYARQTLIYVPRDLPEPREPGWLSAACERMRELIAITDGRAFLLFTSHRALRDASRRLCRDSSRTWLIQGQKPKVQLISEFKQKPGSVLLGTGSFWEGVDVPGDALSLVVIDKLPFAPPTDPLIAARMRQLERAQRDPFTALQVPQAALALKQGFGRLIRRRDDRGIVAVLDRRLVSRIYGSEFFATLPRDVPRTSALEQVRRMWNERQPSTGKRI